MHRCTGAGCGAGPDRSRTRAIFLVLMTTRHLVQPHHHETDRGTFGVGRFSRSTAVVNCRSQRGQIPCSLFGNYLDYVRPTQHLVAALGNYYSGSNASGRDHRVTQEPRCPNRRSTVAPSLMRSLSPHQRSDRSVRQSALPVGADALRREG